MGYQSLWEKRNTIFLGPDITPYMAHAKLFGPVDEPGNELTCKTKKGAKLALFQ